MNTNTNRLSKEDWSKLDEILGRHGFGGYYDLVECLKTVIEKIGRDKLKSDWKEKIRDLPTVVRLLLKVSEEA